MSNINVMGGGANLLLRRRMMAALIKTQGGDTDPEWNYAYYNVSDTSRETRLLYQRSYISRVEVLVDSSWINIPGVVAYQFSTPGLHVVRFKATEIYRTFDFVSALTKLSVAQSTPGIRFYVFRNTRLSELLLPSTFSGFGASAFAEFTSSEDLTIICYALIPPTFSNTSLPNFVKHIYVPAVAVNNYKAAEGWSDYANIIESL